MNTDINSCTDRLQLSEVIKHRLNACKRLMLSEISGHRKNSVVLFAIVLASCSKHEPVPPPIIHINPSPQQNYVVTMRVDDSISNISNVEVVKTYEISNIRECSPIDYTFSMGGSHRPQSKKVMAKYVTTESNEFLTKFSTDHFLNESYYAMEICRWDTSSVNFFFTYKNVQYSAGLLVEDIRKSLDVTLYCRTTYKEKINFGVSCSPRETALKHGVESDYFTVSISTKRIEL